MFPQQQRFVLNTYFETKNHRNIIVNLVFFSLYDPEKDTTGYSKKDKKYLRTRVHLCPISLWVLRQPPIGNMTPYFRGLAPYGVMKCRELPIECVRFVIAVFEPMYFRCKLILALLRLFIPHFKFVVLYVRSYSKWNISGSMPDRKG
jgi:hypothetical protein